MHCSHKPSNHIRLVGRSAKHYKQILKNNCFAFLLLLFQQVCDSGASFLTIYVAYLFNLIGPEDYSLKSKCYVESCPGIAYLLKLAVNQIQHKTLQCYFNSVKQWDFQPVCYFRWSICIAHCSLIVLKIHVLWQMKLTSTRSSNHCSEVFYKWQNIMTYYTDKTTVYIVVPRTF